MSLRIRYRSLNDTETVSIPFFQTRATVVRVILAKDHSYFRLVDASTQVDLEKYEEAGLSRHELLIKVKKTLDELGAAVDKEKRAPRHEQ